MAEPDAAAVELLREPYELGFLPWVARVGGTTLTDDPAHQRVPLLYSVYQAKQWETQNIIETLLASEVIAYAAAPRLKVEGPSDSVQVDYGEPGRPAYVPPGHDLHELDPPGMDAGLAALADRVGEWIGKSTVPRVLQSGDYPAGMAYAALNLATQSGVKSLAPYKELAEQALADVLMQMPYWVDHSGERVTSYGQRRDDRGREYILDPDTFDVYQTYISVELTADVPTDRMARINAGAMAVRELGYSRARALEQVGEQDPGVIMQEAFDEELARTRLEVEKQRRLALGQWVTRRMVGRIVGEDELLNEEGEELEDLAHGPGFNPAQGGTPGVMARGAPGGVGGE